MKYCLIITHEHYSWRKKPHVIFFLYSVFLFQGWTLTLRWEFCNLPQQKLLQGKFGKIITKIDPFSENRNKMKIESKAIQVRAGNTWDYFSKDNSDLGMRNWHQHGSIVEGHQNQDSISQVHWIVRGRTIAFSPVLYLVHNTILQERGMHCKYPSLLIHSLFYFLFIFHIEINLTRAKPGPSLCGSDTEMNTKR